MPGFRSNWEIDQAALASTKPGEIVRLKDKHAERKRIEAALKHFEKHGSDVFANPMDDLKDAARKHLDTLPVPRVVYKVTGHMPKEGRRTKEYRLVTDAAKDAACWILDGMEHVAIFRDEV
jgi:predicted ArsR family transcriptional regulator